MKTMRIRKKCGVRRDTGSVLITAMIFLMILTMIVLAVVASGTLEERMAANDRNRQVAMQSAEAVLRDSEISLRGTPFYPFVKDLFTDDCTRAAISTSANNDTHSLGGGLCNKLADGTTPRWKTIDWTSATISRTFVATASELSGLPSQPRYIVEIVSEPTGCTIGTGLIVNVTARGVGRDNAEFIVQGKFEIPPPGC